MSNERKSLKSRISGTGKERPGLLAKCLYALVLIVGIGAIGLGIIAMRGEPEAITGSQSFPEQVASEPGRVPAAAAKR